MSVLTVLTSIVHITIYKILHDFWDKWIVQTGKTFVIGKTKTRFAAKTAHSVLVTWDEAKMSGKPQQGGASQKEMS